MYVDLRLSRNCEASWELSNVFSPLAFTATLVIKKTTVSKGNATNATAGGANMTNATAGGANMTKK
jgi:hypothetical protein